MSLMLSFVLGCVHPVALSEPALPLRPATLAEVALVGFIAGVPHLVGTQALDAVGPWTFDEPGGGAIRWVSPDGGADPARPVGSRWQVGGQVCTVEGHLSVAEEYTDVDPGEDGYEAPSCGNPVSWARLACAAPVDAELAVPEGAAPPALALSLGEVSDVERTGRADQVGRATSSWTEALAKARGDAEVRVLGISERVRVRAWTLDGARILLFEGEAWSGEGWYHCGGEDVFGAVAVLMTDTPEPRVLFEAGVSENLEISGLMDVERDGIPEIRLGPDGTSFLTATGYGSLRTTNSCVCGC